MATTTAHPLTAMDFAHRITQARQHRSLTQDQLADTVGIHVSQIRRYEAGTSAPTLDVLKRITIALNTSADSLVFDPDERDPHDDLRYHFEAAAQLDDNSQQIIRTMIEALTLRHQSIQIVGHINDPTTS